ncbi:MAG: diguanylate cyclase [Candidatus Omnitrophica bacterium]|nr:diguanylate cyclase [Candidatus Omnitrophota bacterium]
MKKRDSAKLKKELEEKSRQIEKVQKNCDKLLKVKDEFISVVSHELRTPLSIIKEGVNLTLDEVGGKINPKQKQYLSVARGSIERLSNLINDLLDISKIEAKKVSLRKSLVNLEAFVKNAISPFKEIAKDKKISVGYKAQGEGMSIFIDIDKMAQVLNNLVSNALKFTKKNGRVHIVAQEGPNNFQISVCDTGTGISKQNSGKLFDKFIQVGRTYGPGEKGTGLGLTISKALIELHGGRIWVESTLGKGSKFHFTIPKSSFEEVFRGYVKDGIRESQDRDAPFSILVAHIDNFEDLKKRHGPIKAHHFLGEVADVVKETLRRATDVLLRDSTECVVLLPDTDKNGVAFIEKRIRKAMTKAFISKKLDRGVQVSFGSSTCPEDAADNIEMIARARAFFEILYLGKERRRFERRYAKLNIEFLNLAVKKKMKGKEKAQSVNISRGGLCLFSKRKIPKGYKLELVIKLPQKTGTINATAKVVWIKKISRLTGFNYKMGIRYEDMDQRNIDEIMNFISGL